MTDVSVCIVNFNAREHLENCLVSVINSMKKHTYEIIVVDNGSSDGSAELSNRYPNIKFIKNQENAGFIKANNQAIRASTGSYVMSLNNDTIVKDGAIDLLVDLLESSPDAGAAGPKLLNSDGTVQLQCRRRLPDPVSSFYYFSGLSRLFPKSRMFGAYLMVDLDDKQVTEVDCLCGAAMLVRRKVIDEVGLMDEDYFMYGDDIDWCYRIKKAGWKILYCPDAEIVHLGGRGGSRKRSYGNIFEFHRSMALFYSKHYASRYVFAVNWLVYSGIWLKYAVALAMNIFRKEKFVGTKKP